MVQGSECLSTKSIGEAPASPHLALQQGAINIALEAAMTDEFERVLQTADLQVDHYTVMFVKRGDVGPFVGTATLVGAQGPRIGIESTLVDEGSGGRVVATSLAAFHRLGP